MTKAQIEKKYGVAIEWNHWNEEYIIYSADGCRWDCGFHTIKECAQECKEWGKELIQIKNNVTMEKESLR